jgi:hypothetical protein
MNEGCSACACGVQRSCDQFYLPEFLWPGIITLGLALLILIFLRWKRIIKLQLKVLFGGWFILVLVFAGIVYLKTESVGNRTWQAAKQCQVSGKTICEY